MSEQDAGLQPFGTPEGSRANISELRDDRFVHFEQNVGRFGGLAISPSDLTARVFVGRKGAGKTVYLRRAQAYAQDQDNLFADDIQQELPTTTQIFGVNRWFAPSVLTQVWMSIWRVAILRSLFSYLSYEPRLRTPATSEFRKWVLADYGRWLPAQRDPMTVYSQVRAIVRLNQSGPQLHRYLNHEDWDAIEKRLARHLRNCRPVCFYLDAIDEEFRHAPTHWLMCQKGLFYQVMRFLRDNALGGTLHIVISIRDLVYSSVMQTEHMTRYVDPERIRLLEWDTESIQHLLQTKVSQLDRSQYMGDLNAASPLSAWLGRDRIDNEKRHVNEDLEHYLLRHTRLIPRDIVILLNMLHLEASATKEAGEQLTDERIREVTSEAARLFGTEQLAISGNQLAIDDLPAEAAEDEYVELYSGEHPEGRKAEEEIAPGIEFLTPERRYEYRGLDVYDGENPILRAASAYQRGIIEQLSELVREIGVDRFSTKVFAKAQAAAEQRFPESRALSVLWQNGLLGYTEGAVTTGDPVFYSATRADPLEVPTGKRGYVLHPCLIDALGIKSKGAPIYPFSTRRR